MRLARGVFLNTNLSNLSNAMRLVRCFFNTNLSNLSNAMRLANLSSIREIRKIRGNYSVHLKWRFRWKEMYRTMLCGFLAFDVLFNPDFAIYSLQIATPAHIKHDIFEYFTLHPNEYK